MLATTLRVAGGRGLGKIRPLKRIYAGFFRAAWPKSVTVDGHQIWLDANESMVSYALALEGAYDVGFTSYLKQVLRPGDVFVDVGANIGYFTLLAARAVGPTGRVYAFEPDPTNFALLTKNVHANGYGNVVAEQKAVSDRSGNLRLFLSPQNSGDHRTWDSNDGRPSIAVDAVTLDDYFGGAAGPIRLVKMDIQGFEFLAARGMHRTLAEPKVTVVSEFWPAGLVAAGQNPAAFLDYMAQLGFEAFELDSKGTLRSGEGLLERYPATDAAASPNVVWKRREPPTPTARQTRGP